MKQKRFNELAQYGYILFGSLFAVFALAGSLLNNEFLIILSAIMLLYIPVMVCAITIQSVRKENKSRKKKRVRLRRKMEIETYRCPSCDKTYIKNELDLPPDATPFCPECEERLLPYHYSSK